jgi:tRNA A-37 threonylcarbamoyl transferase component Bud32
MDEILTSKLRTTVAESKCATGGEKLQQEIMVTFHGHTVSKRKRINVEFLLDDDNIASGSVAKIYKPQRVTIGEREVQCVIKKYNLESGTFRNELAIYEEISRKIETILHTSSQYYARKMAEILPTCHGYLEFTDGTKGLLLAAVNGHTLEEFSESDGQSVTNAGDKYSKFLLMAQIAFAGAAFHELGIEHGDFHSGNIILPGEETFSNVPAVAVDLGEAYKFQTADDVERKCYQDGLLCDRHRFAISIAIATLFSSVLEKISAEVHEAQLDVPCQTIATEDDTEKFGTSNQNVKNFIAEFRKIIGENDVNKSPISTANSALTEGARYSPDELAFISNVLLRCLTVEHHKLPSMLWVSMAFELASTGMGSGDIFKILDEEFPLYSAS